MKGKHDDLIMAMAMAIYVGESSFSQLTKADEMTKAMLDSWVTHKKENDEQSVDLRPGRDSNVLNPHITPQATQQGLYREYSWLFGAKPK